MTPLPMTKQDFQVDEDKRRLYGEIRTDYALIEKMLDMIPAPLYRDPALRWLDPCAGNGYFSIAVYNRLFKGLEAAIPDPERRRGHILTYMLFIVELNDEHLPALQAAFGATAQVATANFLEMDGGDFDVIVGNPPFTVAGAVKTPAGKQAAKQGDGVSVWASFIKTAVRNLKAGGFLAFITPSIWMKRDHPMHDTILQYDLEKLHTMSNTEANRVFHGHCNTPCSYFLLRKATVYGGRAVHIHDAALGRLYPYPFRLCDSLPLYAISVIARLRPFLLRGGHIEVQKTNMPRKGVRLSETASDAHPHPCVRSCVLKGDVPVLKTEFSNIPCAFAGQRKLILAHKMYGFPWYDPEGAYGISNRDNYVILGDEERLLALRDFLSTNLALYLFEATRYRMKYLERYVFEMIPDITRLSDCPLQLTDAALADYFGLSADERAAVGRSPFGGRGPRRKYKRAALEN